MVLVSHVMLRLLTMIIATTRFLLTHSLPHFRFFTTQHLAKLMEKVQAEVDMLGGYTTKFTEKIYS